MYIPYNIDFGNKLYMYNKKGEPVAYKLVELRLTDNNRDTQYNKHQHGLQIGFLSAKTKQVELFDVWKLCSVTSQYHIQLYRNVNENGKLYNNITPSFEDWMDIFIALYNRYSLSKRTLISSKYTDKYIAYQKWAWINNEPKSFELYINVRGNAYLGLTKDGSHIVNHSSTNCFYTIKDSIMSQVKTYWSKEECIEDNQIKVYDFEDEKEDTDNNPLVKCIEEDIMLFIHNWSDDNIKILKNFVKNL